METVNVFRTFISGYVLEYREMGARYYFRLAQTAPNNCRWVYPDSETGKHPETVSFLLDAFRGGRKIEFTMRGPKKPYKGSYACEVSSLYVTFHSLEETVRRPRDEEESYNEIYKVTRVRIENDEPMRTIFTLNLEKEGCKEIVFFYKENDELKSILTKFFEQGDKTFDFKIKDKLGNRQCTIDMVVHTK